QLSHRRLADCFLGGQRRKPNRPFTAHPVQHERGGRTQIGAISEKPRGQVQCLIEKLADVIEGVFVNGRISHSVSISRALCSGNRSALRPWNSHFTGIIGPSPLFAGPARVAREQLSVGAVTLPRLSPFGPRGAPPMLTRAKMLSDR
ncbi:MAG: hypothetical protein QOI25_2571, partial [Mycobacterium sp.]|nr:hypothetical protein [Mycobacterium sp.]